MRFRVGTSGYSYKEWKGNFYPEKLPQKDMLRYYGERFSTVEINNTFYRMPKSSVLESWREQVPESFRFVLKASQRITHQKRLKDVDEAMGYQLRAVAALKEQAGPLLFQLPPNLKKDAARLSAFLELLPEGARAAFEFRHSSWFDEEVFDLLRARSCALCIADVEDTPVSELVGTTGWGYLRLRRDNYAEQELREWIKRIKAQAWEGAFVFFKHEDAGIGPRLAARFLELAEE